MRMDVMRDVVLLVWVSCGGRAAARRPAWREATRRGVLINQTAPDQPDTQPDQPDKPQPGCYTQNMYSRVMPARALARVGPADVASSSYGAAACRCALVGPRGPGGSPSDKEPPTDDEDDDEEVRGRGGGPGCRGITSDLPLPPGGSVAPWR